MAFFGPNQPGAESSQCGPARGCVNERSGQENEQRTSKSLVTHARASQRSARSRRDRDSRQQCVGVHAHTMTITLLEAVGGEILIESQSVHSISQDEIQIACADQRRKLNTQRRNEHSPSASMSINAGLALPTRGSDVPKDLQARTPVFSREHIHKHTKC